MTFSTAALNDLSHDSSEDAWLVLLTLDHSSFDEPIRISSDGVDTVSRGFVFSHFPFTINLPDDAEGRITQSTITIDNTSLEIIYKLRAIEDPLTISIEIIRSSDTDFVERSWHGMKWISSTYDVGIITGILSIEDFTAEEFGMTFDRRYRGLFT